MKSVLKNSCIKTPVNPFNNLPCPNYERKIRPNSSEKMYLKTWNENKQSNKVINKNSELFAKDNIFSLVEFYDSIPGT